jgi:hypothetical protein
MLLSRYWSVPAMDTESVSSSHPTDSLDAYFDAVVREGLWSSAPALRRYVNWLFRDVPLARRRNLDIGGGAGVFSLYAAAMGAAEVFCLEPEAAGGTRGMHERFERLHRAVGRPDVRLLPETFQAFQAPAQSVDVVLLHNSVNHLDEAATQRLTVDAGARRIYVGLFGKLASLLARGGHVVITDCARTNLFPLLGLPHPVNRAVGIEWHKHQDPEVWAALLEEAGFIHPVVAWSSYNRLGRVGWALLANRIGAFFATGHFRLMMRKEPYAS